MYLRILPHDFVSGDVIFRLILSAFAFHMKHNFTRPGAFLSDVADFDPLPKFSAPFFVFVLPNFT